MASSNPVRRVARGLAERPLGSDRPTGSDPCFPPSETSRPCEKGVGLLPKMFAREAVRRNYNSYVS